MADYRSSQAPNIPGAQGTGRRSQPGIWTPYMDGGIGIIPRRNLATPSFLRTSAALSGLAFSNPLRLLTMIIDSDPDASLAVDTILNLTTGDVQIVAMGEGVGDGAADPVGTAAIDKLLRSLPNEIGGLEGLQGIGTLMTLCTGMTALEAVPGEPLTGVRRIWPVDSLSLMMARETNDSDVTVFQRQNRIDPALFDPIYPGFVRMNPETFKWKPYQPVVDDPYGRASLAPALAEILCNLHILQSLRDCVDHTAWARGVVELDSTALFEIAKKLGYQDTKENPEATKWVLEQYQNVVSTVQNLKSDDWLVLGMTGKAVMMQGGSFAGLEPILNELRSRIVRGLKMLPVVMAFQQGSTEGHTSVQWQIFARRLEAIRSAVLLPILEACNLHLRLLGLNLFAVAKYQPIRTTDAMVEAQTKAIQLANAAKEVLLGWVSNEAACIAQTGRAPVGNPEGDRAMLILVAGAKTAPASPETAGSTQEETDAQQGQAAAA